VCLLHELVNVVGICGPLLKLVPPGFTDVESVLWRALAPDVVVTGQRWTRRAPLGGGDEVHLWLIVEQIAVDDEGEHRPRLQCERRLAHIDIADGVV